MYEIEAKNTSEFSAQDLDELRSMLLGVFGPRYDETAWEHCLGGIHFLLRYQGRLVSHGSLVPRRFVQAERELNGVYGESMATVKDLQGSGLGTVVAALATAHIRLHYEIGAFGASKYHFYERLGWRRWQGPTFVLTQDGRAPAAPDRGSVMALLPPDSTVDPAGDLATQWRSGDIW
jgi:aminoglycoside 2'-N-acetyltransferase I